MPPWPILLAFGITAVGLVVCFRPMVRALRDVVDRAVDLFPMYIRHIGYMVVTVSVGVSLLWLGAMIGDGTTWIVFKGVALVLDLVGIFAAVFGVLFIIGGIGLFLQEIFFGNAPAPYPDNGRSFGNARFAVAAETHHALAGRSAERAAPLEFPD